MKTRKLFSLGIGFLVVVGIVMLSAPVWAGEKKHGDKDVPPVVGDCSGDTSCNTVNVTGGEGGNGTGGDAHAEGGAGGSATAATGAINNRSTGGGAEVNTRSESNSVYLGAARDTADCYTKVQLGAEGFGIGFSRSDAFCKKVRLIDQKVSEGNYAAAVRLECTLPEWREVYGHKRPRDRKGRETEGYRQCKKDLMPAETVGQNVTAAYGGLVVQAVQQDEFQDSLERAEYRYAHQQSLIELLRDERQDDAEKIDRLKREAAALRRSESAAADRRAAVRAKLEPKKEEK